MAKRPTHDTPQAPDDPLQDLSAVVDPAAAPPHDGTRPLVPESNGSPPPHAVTLLFEACERFGISPFADQLPQELLSWRFYPGSDDPRKITPDAVVLVTAGGFKLKHWDDPDEPMDPDTEERLRRLFGCYEIDPVTQRAIPTPLPADLRLTTEAVTGEILSTDHQYVGGYLREGGAAAADAKEQRRQARQRRLAGHLPGAAWSASTDGTLR
jgi:hypothetical protein